MSVTRFARRLMRRALGHLGLASLHPTSPDVQLRRFNDAVLLERMKSAGDKFRFVQIGANDGVSFDSLYRHITEHRCRGLVIEPVVDYFEELKLNYSAHPQVTTLRVAIHATAKEIDIHRVDPGAEGFAFGRKGVASFDPDHHKKSATKTSDMVVEKVPCISWSELLDQQQITRLDYLQIDTEGYDFEILKMVVDEFRRCRPDVIKFEHAIGFDVMSPTQFGQVAESLTAAGYLIVMGPNDAIAHLVCTGSSQNLE